MNINNEMDEETPKPRRMTACPLCGSNQTAVLYDGLADRWFGSPGRWRFDICRSCDLAFLNPQPTAQQLNESYRDYFTHQAPNKANEQNKNENPEPWLLAHAKKAYRFAMRPVERKRLAMRTMYISNLDQGHLLDVGCGNGLFLKCMKDLGWCVQGVELDIHSARIARDTYNLDVFAGTLADAGFPSDHFDCLTMSHVIEHLRDPRAVLAECLRVLKPRGMLVIATPNYHALGRYLFGKRWLGLDPPRHLLLFSRKSLERITDQAGFMNARTHTSGIRADMILNDMARIQSKRSNWRVRQGWYVFSQMFLLLELAANALFSNVGEDLILRAQK
jgi:2-polyprenyl-3-methyl-5-hydroxy-6-metoxy-1,4-benzoquinol methylase